MKTALITGKTNVPLLAPTFDSLQEELAILGVDSFVVTNDEDVDREFDIVFTIGGDGSFVGAVRKYVYYNVPVVAIKGGNVGFLANIDPKDFKTELPKIFNHPDWTKRMVLSGIKSDVEPLVALNEFLFSCDKKGSLSEFSVYIDDKQIMQVRADALLIASPTGSTAYNLSAGGPISLPDMELLTIIPVCSHVLGERPLVIDSNSIIKIVNDTSASTSIWADGQDAIPFKYGESFTLTKPIYVNSLKVPPEAFFSALSDKLGWSLGIKNKS